MSSGEAHCYRVLERLGISPKKEYRISLLPRYRFDYYFSMEGREYLLEFDGRQHFEASPWFGRRRSLAWRQRRDLLKSTVAVFSGYCLLRVSYRDLPFLDDLLDLAMSGQRRFYFSNPDMYSYLLDQPIPPSWISRYGHLPSLRRQVKVVRKF